MAEKGDTNGDSHNNGKYAMYLTVSQPAPDHGPNAIQRGREPESGEDAAHALRRVAQDAAGVVQVSRLRRYCRASDLRLHRDVAIALCSTLAIGQQRAQPAARQRRRRTPAPPAPAGQRGGGRGRGAVQVMTLTSTAWPDGGQIPAKYTQAGDEVSPPLAWSNAPDGVASFVLIVHDVDAAIGNGTDDMLHWMLWNIPGAATRRCPKACRRVAAARRHAADQRDRSVLSRPGAPASGPAHHYVFELFALDAMLDVRRSARRRRATRAAVVAAMAGHVRGKAVYVGLFKRRP